MQINTNLEVLTANRANNRNQRAVTTALQRLSSGLRINHAVDDAAGLNISTRMSAQLNGLRAGARNANDAVSMMQTADGGLQSITDMLQRLRELSVQAANTGIYSVLDRQALQTEANALSAEITRTAKNTSFNGIKILDDTAHFGTPDGGKFAVVDALKRSWLAGSVDLISKYFGISPRGTDFTVDLDGFTDGAGGTLARVSAAVGAGVGNINNMKLEIDMADFANFSAPNGGAAPFYYDRIIAHEMVHAVMNDQTDMSILPTWFKEGSAEIIHGADERVVADGGATAVIAGSTISGGAWGGASIDYSKAYLAARYLHLKAGGFSEGNPTQHGLGRVMSELHSGATLDQAIQTATGGQYANEAAFLADFDANGQTFLQANGLDLTNTDTGSIGGTDAENGFAVRDGRTAEQVVTDVDEYDENPTNFNVIWPFTYTNPEGPVNFLHFQIGADAGNSLEVGYASASARALRVDELDLVNYAPLAIGRLDAAIGYVNNQRARIGAQMNRLEYSVSLNETQMEGVAASRSRILDADYATETAALTRSMILSQAANAMISQAQSAPQIALSLLRSA